MASEWKEFFLAEVGRIVTGKTPKGGIPEYEGKEVQFVTPADFVGDKWITRTSRTISEAGAQSVKGSVIEPRNVLVTCIGSDMGKAAIATKRCVANQQINSILVDESKFCAEFIYYNLSLRKNEIRGVAGGSAQPILNKSAFSRLRLNAPVLSEQKRISAMLRPLDERITLLRETNETLEAIAQALFKSWFVDFDPVRAKSEGRLPEGMDEATAALFPDTFEETELGVVPKGWTIGKLSDVVSLRNERIQPSAEVRQMPYVPIESIATKNPFLIDAKSGEEANSSLTLFREGDILFGAMRPYFHKVCVAPFDGVTRTTVFPLKPNSEKERGFGLFCVYQNTTIDFATQNSEGSTIPYAKWKGSLELMGCLIPSKELREEFSKLVGTFVDKANANISTLKTLSNLRDTLLPRLISGQLRVADAEAELEKVTA